jgi:phosphocarrier protein HPr
MLLAKRQLDITNTLGLHLRAAGAFVKLAQQFRAEVWVICNGRRASGKSILDLATLAAECGCRLELETAGPDAESALDALSELIARRFDEEA